MRLNIFILALAIATAIPTTAQLFAEPGIGLSGRLKTFLHADAGYQFASGWQVATTASYEAGHQVSSLGIIAGHTWPMNNYESLTISAGYGYVNATASKLEGPPTFYTPIVVLRYGNRAGFMARYQGGTISLGFGVCIGGNH